MNTSKSQTKPFQDKDHVYTDLSISSSARDSSVDLPVLEIKSRRRYALRRHSIIFTIFNLLFIIGNTIFFVRTNKLVFFIKRYCPDLPSSPEKTGIFYETQIMELGGYNPYGDGNPPEVVNEAWDNLMDNSYFRATKEEMIEWGEFGDDSIALENGGYLAYLRVYGELHCMDWFKRQYADPEARKAKNITEKDRDHCVNVLMQGVMCRADVTLSGWYIDPDIRHNPLINRTAASHVCTNWDSVERWLEPRKLKRKNGVPEGAVMAYGQMSHHDMLAHAKFH